MSFKIQCSESCGGDRLSQYICLEQFYSMAVSLNGRHMVAFQTYKSLTNFSFLQIGLFLSLRAMFFTW